MPENADFRHDCTKIELNSSPTQDFATPNGGLSPELMSRFPAIARNSGSSSDLHRQANKTSKHLQLSFQRRDHFQVKGRGFGGNLSDSDLKSRFRGQGHSGNPDLYSLSDSELQVFGDASR